MTKLDHAKFKSRLRDKGMTITGWCRVHGFHRVSVHRMLAGKWGIRAGEANGGPVSNAILYQMETDNLI